jgi:pyruvate/2-oxoglutarate dehydrogenase complex dihydrolipoamide acyltransferase (E2) component
MSEFTWRFPDLKSESIRNPDLPNPDENKLQIQQWLAHEGNRVEANQPLVSLTTEDEDIVVSVDSPVTGTLTSLCLQPGQAVSRGVALAIFELED